MVICVYGASSDTIHPDFLKAGEALGAAMARRGHSLVFGGGGHGLMGAVARGVASGGGSITGVAPRFFNVDGVLFDGCTEFVYTDTMRERKAIMEERADAFLMTPGGIGTFEEFFEILTLRQLGGTTSPSACSTPGIISRPFTPCLKPPSRRASSSPPAGRSTPCWTIPRRCSTTSKATKPRTWTSAA